MTELPAGRIDAHETLEEGLVREVEEETGITGCDRRRAGRCRRVRRLYGPGAHESHAFHARDRRGDARRMGPPRDRNRNGLPASSTRAAGCRSKAAYALPGPGWTRRVQAGTPEGVAEHFLSVVRQQVLARAEQNAGNSIETDCVPLIDGLAEAAEDLASVLHDLKRPMAKLAEALAKKLDDEAQDLSTYDRGRIEAVSRSLKKRGELMVGGWIDMLARLLARVPAGWNHPAEKDSRQINMLEHVPTAKPLHTLAGHALETRNPLFVEWFSIDQIYGREADVGLHSHWVDPTEPLALAVLKNADGVIITSATLKDRPPDVPDDWANAEMRTGAVHLPYPVKRVSYDSPFDYASKCRLLVVNDVNREDMDQVAAAYRELFVASRGGALGLFTAISRLRAVHKRLSAALAQKGLSLYAQHVDPMDTGTLVDMFRAERDACLLGTDAVRDGVDVPGDSLRLIVLDRVPWGTPTILERARRETFGGNAYTDMVVRLRLRQAFGRLIRSEHDRGCFVILDPRLASRFTTAFPPGVAVERVGLVEAIERVKSFTR